MCIYMTSMLRLLTMHKLKVLVHDSLEEPPMSSKESRILPHDVHDVTGYDGLVVFPSLLLTQTQQVLDDSDQKSLLVLLVHGPTKQKIQSEG